MATVHRDSGCCGQLFDCCCLLFVHVRVTNVMVHASDTWIELQTSKHVRMYQAYKKQPTQRVWQFLRSSMPCQQKCIPSECKGPLHDSPIQPIGFCTHTINAHTGYLTNEEGSCSATVRLYRLLMAAVQDVEGRGGA